MRLLVEGVNYQPEDIEEIGLDLLKQKTNEGVNFKYVGYCYDTRLGDCVFFLPKVIVDQKGKVFGNIEPKNLIDFGFSRQANNENSNKKNFLCNLSVWIYRAIKKYVVNKRDGIGEEHIFSNVAINSRKADYTLLDIILSLIKFNNENRNYFMFKVQNQHSGSNNIDWNKTLSRTSSFVDGDDVYYLNPISKSKQINFDEELLVIFYSILNYINVTFGFKSPINLNYKLIQHTQFKRYLRSFGKIRLRQIKYKYFSDKDLALWKLCYSFFEKIGEVNSSSSKDDYLLVSDFNLVFEDMVDDLISDKSAYIEGLKMQNDGKIIDHLFKYSDLVHNNEVYYIGDSKYYKIGDKPHDTAHYKQYTYAKNIIQTMINLFVKDNTSKDLTSLNYRDNLTEGYNVTPNFFISGIMDKELRFSEKGFVDKGFDFTKDISVHFDNRLFDRDTLLLAHFDINFLYVLTMYTSNNLVVKRAFKSEAHRKFRELTVKILNDHYHFFHHDFPSSDALSSFVNNHFRTMIGKMYCPSESGNRLIIAFEIGKYMDNQENPLNVVDENLDLDGVKFVRFSL